MDILSRTREVIFEVFGKMISDDSEKAKRIIEDATFLGKEDPGGWSPNAAVVIHMESGIPSGSYDPRIADMWFDVSDKLKTHFVEHINGAVAGVYKA